MYCLTALLLVTMAVAADQAPALPLAGIWTWRHDFVVNGGGPIESVEIGNDGRYRYRWLTCMYLGEEVGRFETRGRTLRSVVSEVRRNPPGPTGSVGEFGQLLYFAAGPDADFLVEEAAVPEFCSIVERKPNAFSAWLSNSSGRVLFRPREEAARGSPQTLSVASLCAEHADRRSRSPETP